MKVLLTGCSGFIGSHTLEFLLQKGHNVVITVRSDAKGKQSLDSHPSYASNLSYTVVPDMTISGAFNDAVQSSPEFDAVIHMASPFTFDVKDFKRDTIDPAVEGTTEILRAIKGFAPSVKRVVVTSSFAAVMNLTSSITTYTAENWNPITEEAALSNSAMAYIGSKTFAERAAWDFVKNEKPNFTLATINPCMVFGPVTYQLRSLDAVNTSNAVFRDMIVGKMKESIPENAFQWVDVRDVAFAHVRAMEVPEAGGQRFLTAAGAYSNAKIAEIIRENFPELRDEIAEQPASEPSSGFTIDCTPAKELLGITFKTLEESTVEAVKTLLAVKA
ncbi:dihydroflavonol-4-reductase [Boeremia exigua]|uniref:dihydroflavonol-4-reductase n=1 Tax=Boeremia exigua TaxID=749465 RepID=UPI001E8DA071|nr:dihydroflavonol-4-reductase [Boeremia exigua]KAH6644881.1 dihydroflavonol-4-reductase [Boeremia exigua]